MSMIIRYVSIFPVGHVSDNLPMIEGADVVFSVGERSVDLSFCIK